MSQPRLLTIVVVMISSIPFFFLFFFFWFEGFTGSGCLLRSLTPSHFLFSKMFFIFHDPSTSRLHRSFNRRWPPPFPPGRLDKSQIKCNYSTNARVFNNKKKKKINCTILIIRVFEKNFKKKKWVKERTPPLPPPIFEIQKKISSEADW